VFEVKNIDPKVAKSTRTGRHGSRDTASGTLWPELLKRTTRYAPNASSLSASGPLSSNGGPMQPALASAQSRLLFDDVPQADYTFRLTRVRSDAISYSAEVWTCAIPAFPGAKDVGDDFNRSLGMINEVIRNLQNSTADK
jgi:hypothetical protein